MAASELPERLRQGRVALVRVDAAAGLGLVAIGLATGTR
jgi:hypothetical protein